MIAKKNYEVFEAFELCFGTTETHLYLPPCARPPPTTHIHTHPGAFEEYFFLISPEEI